MGKRKRSMCVPETCYRCTYFYREGGCDYRLPSNDFDFCYHRDDGYCTNKLAQRAARRRGGERGN